MSLRNALRASCLAGCLLYGAGAWPADACSEYKWDISSEVRLFAGTPTPLDVGTTVPTAPAITAGKLYALTLHPQESIQYAAEPSKKMLADGAFGGLMKLKVERAGAYRVSIDSGFWLDIVNAGKSLPALDFNGVRQCVGPHKIVVYDLPAGVELTLQIASASENAARLTVTPVAAPGA